MQSLKNRKTIIETQTLIKESLLCQLSHSIKEIQLTLSQRHEVFSTYEGCNSLIIILEAIFLHGLKLGIFKSAWKAVAGVEEKKPQPSFWNMVCNFTHKDTIHKIKNLSQITNDVGRCRVWIRLALNEFELTSYFTAMEKDRKLLNSFYSNYAFLRDREMCDTACKFLEGILSVQFEIPLNSSILNVWSNEPLIKSGLWSSSLKTPVGTAIDVAEKIEDDEEHDIIKTSSSLTTLLAIDETQTLKLILEAPFTKSNCESNSVSSYESSMPHSIEKPLMEEKEETLIISNINDQNIINEQSSSTPKENLIGNATGWSSVTDIIPDPVKNVQSVKKDPKSEDYSTLLEKVGISPNKKVNYEDRLKEMMERQNIKQKESIATNNAQSKYYTSYTTKLYKIVRESGLKAQKYTCANCEVSIGLTFGEARLCYFTGEYYCVDCHLNETSVIPSRIIFNWDHKKYPVCCKASKYLNDIGNHFLIDIKNINPKLYSAVPEMKNLRIIRLQLNMLRTYLYTCKESLLIELQKKVAPREHIYEFIDHYSIKDLCQIPGGGLASELTSIVTFGKNHVINCWVCNQKGFICEICKNSKIIFPFDILTTYRCGNCFAIYHDTCLSSSENCPKCIRIKKRNSPKIK